MTSGLIIGSFGLGTIIFDLIEKHIANPNNLQAVDRVFPPEVTANVPKMLQFTCWIYIIMMILSIVFIFQAEEISINLEELTHEGSRIGSSNVVGSSYGNI